MTKDKSLSAQFEHTVGITENGYEILQNLLKDIINPLLIMIDRYSRKELKNIWSEENKYKIWLDIEIAADKQWKNTNLYLKVFHPQLKKKQKIKVKRIHEIESKVKHDVIAFLTSISEQAGIKARYLHQGMTSSDVLDTSI